VKVACRDDGEWVNREKTMMWKGDQGLEFCEAVFKKRGVHRGEGRFPGPGCRGEKSPMREGDEVPWQTRGYGKLNM